MAHVWEITTLSLIARDLTIILHDLKHSKSINSIKQQAMGGPPAKGWADDWWLTIKSWHVKKCHNEPQQALGSVGINHWVPYKAARFLKVNFHYTLSKKNSTRLCSFCLLWIAQDRPSTCLCFPLPLAYQSHIKIVLKGTEIHMTKPHHKTVLIWCKLHLSTLTAGNFTTTQPKVSRHTWANNFTR
jgi:hypothetical protein